jgi:hypothetical protein
MAGALTPLLRPVETVEALLDQGTGPAGTVCARSVVGSLSRIKSRAPATVAGLPGAGRGPGAHPITHPVTHSTGWEASWGAV